MAILQPHEFSLMTSRDDTPNLFEPLPGRAGDRSAAYEALLHNLLDLLGAEAVEAPKSASPASDRRGVTEPAGKSVKPSHATP